MKAVNQYGRQWGELDAMRANLTIDGPLYLASKNGVPLCGRHVSGHESVYFTAVNWKA